MATLKRKSILDALEVRLKTITVANGYRTPLGSDVKIYRMDVPRPDSTGTAKLMADIRDSGQEPMGQAVNSPQNGLDWSLIIDITVYGWYGGSTADVIRNAISDIYKAIGTDITFGGLAWQTVALGDEIDVEQEAYKLGVGLVKIAINYRNAFWSGE